MLFELVLLTTGGVGLVSSQSTLMPKAVTATGLGHIGVDPVSLYPEESYHVLHAHTQYWDQGPTTTKWIGVNTELLTDLPYVTTVDNNPTVTTAPANIAASLIASPTDGAAVGDIAVTFSEKLSKVLNEIAAEVETTPCARRKRQVCEARASEFAHRVASELESGGRLSFVADNPTVLVTASDVAAIVKFVAGTRARTIVSLAVTAYMVSKSAQKVPSVFKLMKDMASAGGAGSDEDSCPPFELQCDGCKGNALGICVFPWAGCPCKKTEECPNPQVKCKDEKCQGDSDNFCTNEHKGCTCEPEEKGECPEEIDYWPECNDCNGDLEVFKCAEEYNGAKDCICLYFPQVGIKPLLDTLDLDLAQRLMPEPKPEPPKPEEPADHACNTPGNFWFTKGQGLTIVDEFCNSKSNDGGSWLRYRKSGTTDDMSNAVVSYYPVDNTDNTNVRIYAFIDESEDCKNRFPEGMHMNHQNCVDGLSFLVNKCQEGQDDQKFGGEGNIQCHYFNMTPVEKRSEAQVPEVPEEPHSVPSTCCDGFIDNSCC
ncbi:hypothetical protein K458DRAFT_427295 [Lentithecium fluviatile CBS 122367]|uniref:Uncharacterized protein n=1 Tax=Lentithecium fluviatile CBS 122367 TaxID=1168545 RepID=A0A6G1JFT3_9PLEO|nr:hypothetical protein K458DRAFT_427295 [Lentithecium fluviatile CBS 122367]